MKPAKSSPIPELDKDVAHCAEVNPHISLVGGSDAGLTTSALAILGQSAPFVEFDDASHTYYADGEKAVSVTQVLTEAGFVDAQWYTERSRLRGTLVHQLIAEHIALTRLGYYTDPIWEALLARIEQMKEKYGDDVAEEVVEHFNSYIVWRKTLSADQFPIDQVEGLEELVFDPGIGCAGRLDLRGTMADGSPYVMDWKTSASGEPPSWVDLQTVGYSVLQNPGGLSRRFSLTLSPKGAKLDEYAMEEFVKDRYTFLAAVHVVREKRARS